MNFKTIGTLTLFLLSFNSFALVKIPKGKCALSGKLIMLNDFENLKLKAVYLSINSKTNSETRIRLSGQYISLLEEQLEQAKEIRVKISIELTSQIYDFYGSAKFLDEYKILDPFDELPIYKSTADVEKACVANNQELPRYANTKDIFYKRLPAGKSKK